MNMDAVVMTFNRSAAIEGVTSIPKQVGLRNQSDTDAEKLRPLGDRNSDVHAAIASSDNAEQSLVVQPSR